MAEFLYLHMNQETRTRALSAAETWDPKETTPAIHPVSGFPLG
jgi:hypothetical protein